MRPLRHRLRLGAPVVRGVTALALTVLSASAFLPAASGAAAPRRVRAEVFTGEGLADLDARAGSVAPTLAQQDAVRRLGAHASWNRFGSPRSLIRYGGYLATGLQGDAATAARAWIDANRGLFRLSAAGVRGLELLRDSELTGTSAHAVLFRQRFGTLPAAEGGLITVGISDGNVAYVSSSSAGDGNVPEDARISPQAAWLAAAANVRRGVSADAISNVRRQDTWTVFDVAGFAQPQRARLVAVPTPRDGVRPAFETNVVDVRGGSALAYTVFVDAATGDVLVRRNQVDQFALMAPSAGFFQGSTGGAAKCGPHHQFEVPAGTKTIDVEATADDPNNDIVLKLIYEETGDTVAATDTLSSPEAVHYEPEVIPPGTYAAQVCQFDVNARPFSYSGAYQVNDVVQPPPYPYPPKWKFFTNSPLVSYADRDIRILGCWQSVIEGAPVPGCEAALRNVAARGPWDYNFRTNQPTFTTVGNAATTAEAWTSPLTPAENYRPVDPDRRYVFPWTNQWHDEKCSPTAFTSPTRNDIDAAIVNLFSGHNRMHDWSYFLGFTETNHNLQDDNFGNTDPGPFPSGRENDPEYGNVQAGAVEGERNNANQITLQDGVPGITNQYLFQPRPAEFYSPCADGDLDATVYAHEYTHAISNRMVGGPDSGLMGYQPGSMGESWSDLSALEYLHEYGYTPVGGENPWALGAYVTGNDFRGIRDYPLNRNPLNYSDLGFDKTGPEVHADGEVWNGVNFDIRQTLVDKYSRQYPASNATLQRRCADGELAADRCPGNRRWIQIVYDAWLLEGPDVTMLDARDAYLAADVLRFGGANQRELWRAFAGRGMGVGASTSSENDSNPTPSFQTPLERNATVHFDARAAGVAGSPHVDANIFVGRYEARVTPVADTNGSTPLGNTAKFVPGTYRLIAQAPGFGAHRFTLRLRAGEAHDVTVSMPLNLASRTNGARASGDGVDLGRLIDDTEATNWASLDQDVRGRQVTVRLGRRAQRIEHLQVSAMLEPLAENGEDPESRFSALRSFEIWVCNAASPSHPDCDGGHGFTKVYTSPSDFFPGVRPRPVAPDLVLRMFDVTPVDATHVRLVVVDNQCTGGPAYQGDQDNDPTNDSDCSSGSDEDTNVRAAELQVFGQECAMTDRVARRPDQR